MVYAVEDLLNRGAGLIGEILTVSGYVVIAPGRVSWVDPADSSNFEMVYDAIIIPNELDKKMFDLLVEGKYYTDSLLPILQEDFYHKMRLYCPDMQLIFGTFLFAQPILATGKIVSYTGEEYTDVQIAITDLVTVTILPVPPEQSILVRADKGPKHKVIVPFESSH